MAVGQYVKQTEEVTADSPGGRHDGGKKEEVAIVVVVLVIVREPCEERDEFAGGRVKCC